MSSRFLPLLLSALAIAGCSSPTVAPSPTEPPPLPPAQSLLSVVNDADNLSVLAALIDASGMSPTLDADEPFTLFAPSNDAFAALPAGTVDAWLAPDQRDELAARVSLHLVRGRLTRSDLRNGQALIALSGDRIQVRTLNGRLQIGGASLLASNVVASNGLLHVVDSVLAP